MNKSSADLFKKSLDKAYLQPGMTLNQSTMKDNMSYKQSFQEQDELEGGVGDGMTLKKISMKHKVSLADLVDEFAHGVDIEKEHTEDLKSAMEIAMDHLTEDPHYYTKLSKMETKEQFMVRPVSKKTAQKFIGKKSTMSKPIGKLFGVSKIEAKEEEIEVRPVSKKEMNKIIDREDKKSEKEFMNKISAKKQFAQDLQKDKDFQDFKKHSKFEYRGVTDSFGVPNVTVSDPYIKKSRKWGRPGKEKEETKEATSTGSSGAFSGPIAFKDSEFLRKSFAETPKKLKEGFADGIEKVEAKEATTSGSVGGYESPSMWAKSTKKKDWGPSRKTQIPGGSFVQVKKRCTKFPYCNQGDINALKLSKNESVKEAVENIARKYKIGKNVIMNILENEFSKYSKRKK